MALSFSFRRHRRRRHKDQRQQKLKRLVDTLLHNASDEDVWRFSERIRQSSLSRKKPHVLNLLRLYFPQVTDEGADILACLLECPDILRVEKLQIGFSAPIHSPLACPILRALASPTATLESLMIFDHPLAHRHHHYREDDGDSPTLWTHMLQTNSHLVELNLQANGLNDEMAQSIARGLMTNNTLQVLQLFRNPVGDEGSIALSEALLENTCLETLSLQETAVGTLGVSAILRALETNSTLRSFTVDDALEEAEALVVGSTSLPRMKGLKQLVFVGTTGPTRKVDRFVLPPIAQGLEHNFVLKTLDLTRCSHVGDDGAQALAKALLTNNVLVKLVLYRAGIGCVGTTALAQALESNTTLQALDLSHNSIGRDGILNLVESLPRMKGLRKLDLKGAAICEWGLDWTRQLFRNLENNRFLESIRCDCFSRNQKSHLDLIAYYVSPLHRRIIQDRYSSKRLSLALWPFLLSRVCLENPREQAIVLYGYLRNDPTIVSSIRSCSLLSNVGRQDVSSPERLEGCVAPCSCTIL